MSITSIRISNFKSIENIELNFIDKKTVSCFLGKNGVGKSNIFAALNYFYINLEKTNSNQIVDSVNSYNSHCEISIVYDVSVFENKVNNEYSKELFNELLELSKERKTCWGLGKIGLNKIRVTLKQDKDGNISWNQNPKVRKIIAKLFPLYIINTRKLDLITWNQIWDTINDLASDYPKLSDTEVISTLDEAFSKIYGKYNNSKKFVNKLFEDNQIGLDRYHNIQRFKYMFMTIFGGEDFLNDGKNLEFYSDGINSFLYIKLLFSIISQISSLSCKQPLILLDEPEIGLHEAKIDELIEVISENLSKDVFVLINTHSPRVVLELITNDINISIYRLFLHQLHTCAKKLDVNWLRNLKHIITPKETACYFSDYLLFVEGETEHQVFQNKKLRTLFPFLKKIHIYPYGSNNQLIKYVCPLYINIGIPYITILDIDKIIKFQATNENKIKYKAFRATEELNPLKSTSVVSKNKMRFFSAEEKLKKCLQNEFADLLGKSFSYKDNCNYVESANYERLIYLTKKLCAYSQVSVNSTTIEGLLINKENIDIFIEFCLETFSTDKVFLEKVKKMNNTCEKVAVLSLAFDGRLALGQKKLVNSIAGLNFHKIINSKADGWASEWLNWFFEKKCIESETESAEKIFKDYFPELFDTLQMIKNVI